ncbi:MraY family glycosyltransferase [Vogesella indigofera]|uniref:MraY family glycosyltransferase n=1 Tax=Vogesella indigofera TaxID=45465 RepID=UPI00234F6E13|nr:glycosyltransferase [Vogesella indigofera]MDC7696786.1 glycosyltransferase [Vogesella indigofera]
MLLTLMSTAFAISMFVGVLTIRYAHLRNPDGMHEDMIGVQKFHVAPTPRIGGVPIMAGLCAGMIAWWSSGRPNLSLFVLLLVCAAPVFLAGLAEDITRRVSPAKRLFAAFMSAGLGIWLLGAQLPSLGIPLLDDWLLQWPVLAVMLTVFAVGGVCHSINIIDGYNGLMAGVAILVGLAFAYVALIVGDRFILKASLLLVAALVGFMVWNFPRGLIFAGDAGAYLVGFMLAELAVLLVVRHPGVVSPWFPFLVLIYPVFETVFTIYRRKQRKAAAGLPDSMHFHQIIYKRLMRWMVGDREAKQLLKRNSMTSPYLWCVALMTVLPAVFFWQYESVLQGFCVLFVGGYVWLYRRIVRFRSPRWLVYRKVVSTRTPSLSKR